MTVQEGRAVTGALIRVRRQQALLSQEELADRSDLSVRTVRNIETGRVAHPHPKTIRRIMDALAAFGTPFIPQHEGVMVRVSIALLDKILVRAVERADSRGTTLSGLINMALEAELNRRETG
ncbi:MAG: transcriptional regulator [Pseudonocardiales bacterium]|nr:transcriptional regulator [Pseudonocardiales bacterium]